MLVCFNVLFVCLCVRLFVFFSQTDDWIQEPIREKIKSDYTGTIGEDMFTVIMNFLMHNVGRYIVFEPTREISRVRIVYAKSEGPDEHAHTLYVQSSQGLRCTDSQRKDIGEGSSKYLGLYPTQYTPTKRYNAPQLVEKKAT